MDKKLLSLQKKMSDYAKQYGREGERIDLLAVSKGQSIEKIKAAYLAGQRLFGESYLQEAVAKIEALVTLPIEWHFIGPIQSNKTRKIAEHFAWVHSVDNEKIAKRLNDQRPVHLPPLNICIQVNVSGESTKSGVVIDQVLPLAQYCLTLPRLKLRGLMTLPAHTHLLDEQRAEFHKLFLLKKNLQQHHIVIDTLSMGMSDNFEAAIAEGSTLIRLGTAIFGPRK